MSTEDGEPFPEFYDPSLPDNPGRGEARMRVLEALASIQPAVLTSLANLCNKPSLLVPGLLGTAPWHGPLDYLDWVHIRDAGKTVPSLGIVFENLVPIRAAIELWAADEPQHRWNLRDSDREPLDWIAHAAVQTLVAWHQSGRLPKELTWIDRDFHHYRALDSEDSYQMFELEGRLNADYGFRKVSLSDPEPLAHMPFVQKTIIPFVESEKAHRPFNYRERRSAKAAYKSLGKKAGLLQIPRFLKSHYEWYALHTFLEHEPSAIKERELLKPSETRSAVGKVDVIEDVANIQMAIYKLAAMVGFRRPFGKQPGRTELI
jgi:hypothetical protein